MINENTGNTTYTLYIVLQTYQEHLHLEYMFSSLWQEVNAFLVHVYQFMGSLEPTLY